MIYYIFVLLFLELGYVNFLSENVYPCWLNKGSTFIFHNSNPNFIVYLNKLAWHFVYGGCGAWMDNYLQVERLSDEALAADGLTSTHLTNPSWLRCILNMNFKLVLALSWLLFFSYIFINVTFLLLGLQFWPL